MVPRAFVGADRHPSRVAVAAQLTECNGKAYNFGEGQKEQGPTLVLLGGERERLHERRQERSPTRLKRSHHKVRTGCLTCRYDV